MKIFIKKLTGWTGEVTIRNTDSLDSLRQKITNLLLPEDGPLSLAQVQLIFQGNPIDQGTLDSHGVGEGSVLIVVIKEKQFVRITVVVETTNKRITLQVESSETVANVKQMLTQQGYSASEQILFFNSRELTDGRLSHHGISQGAELYLRLRTVQIFVKDTTGKTHTFDIRTSDKVDNFIDQVSRKIGVQKSQLILQFAGKQLQSGCTFQFYGIQEHSTIHQHMRLRGG